MGRHKTVTGKRPPDELLKAAKLLPLPAQFLLTGYLCMADASGYYAHPTAVLDEGCRIGAGCRIWHFTHVSTDAELGEGCSLGQNVFVAEGVKLGRNVKVQNNVSLYAGVECQDDVFLGPSVVFTNVLNPRAAVPRRGAGHYLPTRLAQGVSIGANSTIVCGVSLGEYAFVGAGSVVTKDVAPYALVYGNPARPRGWLSTHGHPLAFDAAGFATCPESQEQYQLTDGRVCRISPGSGNATPLASTTFSSF